MKIKTIYRTAPGKVGLVEIDRDLSLAPDEVLVKGRICGFCKSDVETIMGKNDVSVDIFGHEGVGTVVEKGSNVSEFSEGDFVATYGNGCYGDYYKIKDRELLKVRALSPNFIVQPLATMSNVLSAISLNGCSGILVYGCGSNALLLAKIFYLHRIGFDFIGSHNVAFLESLGGRRVENPASGVYNTVVEISGKQGAYSMILNYVSEGGVIIGAANPEEKESLNLFDFSWKAVTVIFPSPRSKNFRSEFIRSGGLLNSGLITVSDIFEKGYARNDPNQLREALEDRIFHKIKKGYLFW